MLEVWTWIVLCVATLLLGFVIGFLMYKIIPALREKDAKKKAEKILRDAEIRAEQIKKNAQIDGKQTVLEMKQEAEKDIR